jgi:hypothetical protein
MLVNAVTIGNREKGRGGQDPEPFHRHAGALLLRHMKFSRARGQHDAVARASTG